MFFGSQDDISGYDHLYHIYPLCLEIRDWQTTDWGSNLPSDPLPESSFHVFKWLRKRRKEKGDISETACVPIKPKIFTTWPIAENIWRFLFISSCKYHHNKNPSHKLFLNEIWCIC